MLGLWEDVRRPPPQVSAGTAAVSFSRAAVSREMLGGEQEGVGRRGPAGRGGVQGSASPTDTPGRGGQLRNFILRVPSPPPHTQPAFPLLSGRRSLIRGIRALPTGFLSASPRQQSTQEPQGGRKSQNTTRTPDTCHTAAVARCPACLPAPSCLPWGAADSLASKGF